MAAAVVLVELAATAMATEVPAAAAAAARTICHIVVSASNRCRLRTCVPTVPLACTCCMCMLLPAAVCHWCLGATAAAALAMSMAAARVSCIVWE